MNDVRLSAGRLPVRVHRSLFHQSRGLLLLTFGQLAAFGYQGLLHL